MVGVYVWSITHSTMNYELKSSILLTKTGIGKISSVACGLRSIKIDYSAYLKSSISRINNVYFFTKISLKHLPFHHVFMVCCSLVPSPRSTHLGSGNVC